MLRALLRRRLGQGVRELREFVLVLASNMSASSVSRYRRCNMKLSDLPDGQISGSRTIAVQSP